MRAGKEACARVCQLHVCAHNVYVYVRVMTDMCMLYVIPIKGVRVCVCARARACACVRAYVCVCLCRGTQSTNIAQIGVSIGFFFGIASYLALVVI